MKGKILDILRAGDGVASGETVSGKLGISMAEARGHIEELRQFGYDIDESAQGYRMAGSADVLSPWEFAGRETTIHCYSQVGSTMDIARDLARQGCPHFTVVIAERQTKGRGRLKRTWHSSQGGIYFTLVIRPEMPAPLIFRFNFAASLVLAQLLRRKYDVDAMVKWPNDILINGKKVSGMLSEMETEAGAVTFVNIGMGINANNDPSAEEPKASSLSRILGRKISRKDLLSEFLDRFERRIHGIAHDDVIAEWKRYTMTLNRKVRIVTVNDELEGTAVDVDDSGALVLRQHDGSIRRVVYGDCFHV